MNSSSYNISDSVSIQAVAECAGVSRMTVSRVFSGSAPVAPATRDRILSISKRMGYYPNRIAGSLKSGRTHSVGFIWTFISPWSGASTVSLKVLEHFHARDIVIYQFQTNDDVDVLCANIDEMLGRRAEGLVLRGTPRQLSCERVKERLRQMPWVVASSPEPVDGFPGDLVVHDLYPAICQAVGHLAACGRRRIAFVGDIEYETQMPKYRTFLEECNALGLAEHEWSLIPVKLPAGRPHGGQPYSDTIRAVFPNDLPIDAIFCTNDDGAAYIERELLDRGVRIPKDLAIVGFNNADICPVVRPPLATCDPNNERLSEILIELLEARIANTRAPWQQRRVNAEFVWRESAGPPAQSHHRTTTHAAKTSPDANKQEVAK